MLGKTACNDIHQATLALLKTTGVYVEDPVALDLFAAAGADADKLEQRVRLNAELVEAAIGAAPRRITLAGRSPEYDVVLEAGSSAFVNFGGNIRVVDTESRQKRSTTIKDVAAAARLCDALPEIDVYSRAVYALDSPPPLMHIHTAATCFQHTAKHCILGAESASQARAVIDMATAAVGGAERASTRKAATLVTAVSSPLRLTRAFCEVARTSAAAGFPTGIAAMVMAGGTGPINLAGTLVQTNAEILAGNTLVQLTRKGTPVVYMSYSTAMDLKVGASPLASPEGALVASATAELCRHYGLPCKVPGLCADGRRSGIQATFEKTVGGLGAALAGAQLIIGIGGLETGLTFDYGQAVLDSEMVRLIRHLTKGIPVNSETLSLDVIDSVGPFGNFLLHDSTLERMQTLSQTELFDRTSDAGASADTCNGSYERAWAKAIDILSRHRALPLGRTAAASIERIVYSAEAMMSAA